MLRIRSGVASLATVNECAFEEKLGTTDADDVFWVVLPQGFPRYIGDMFQTHIANIANSANNYVVSEFGSRVEAHVCTTVSKRVHLQP